MWYDEFEKRRDEFDKWHDILKDTFEEIYDALTRIAGDYSTSMAELRGMVFYIDDRAMSPIEYGRLLHKASYICPRYNYIRSFKRSMPYHRRQH